MKREPPELETPQREQLFSTDDVLKVKMLLVDLFKEHDRRYL